MCDFGIDFILINCSRIILNTYVRMYDEYDSNNNKHS